MRCLDRNKRSVWYANALDPIPINDEQGNLTGEYETPYTDPQEIYANVSAAVGEAEVLQFGNDVLYDKTIVIEELDLPIDETSVMWIDTAPDKPHDYIVKKVAKSLNVLAVAVSRVKVS